MEFRNNKALTKKGITNNVWKFYLSAFFGSWSFATGILIFHYRELDFSFAQILGIAVVYEVFNFILEIPTGVLADLWSCKKTIMIGYFISGISFFIVLINPNTYIIYDSTAKTRTLTTKHPFLNPEIVRKGANGVVEK